MSGPEHASLEYDPALGRPRGETRGERMRESSRLVTHSLIVVILFYLAMLWGGFIPQPGHGGHAGDPVHGAGHHTRFTPHYWAVLPFAILLLSIAILPLLKSTEHWWHLNRNRFLVAASLGALTLLYYGAVHPGGIANHFTHTLDSAPGWETVFAAFSNAIFSEFTPFIVLLFSLYVISGGINLRGDLPAHPGTNCVFIAAGTVLASFIGTTGAAMVLIRPLLATNAERKHKVHTVIFFIFMVCNCGGLLLPIGDPPLFLGYLKGVPFMWTLGLWKYWLGVNLLLLAIYYFWDRRAYRKEAVRDLTRDETQIAPLQLSGKINLLFLLGVVLCVALIVPDQPLFGAGLESLLGHNFHPPQFFREVLMLLLVILSLAFTHPHTRVLNRFDYLAIAEVGALFCGIFICMQVPVEILNLKGSAMGIDSPLKFFWATGMLSSFLDNAPTYVVFFETAKTLPADGGTLTLLTGGQVKESLLVAISLGAVLMGANTYIGNGPNFMVKSIAEQSGVRMPSFFGYMLYSGLILIPIFVLMSWLGS